MNIEVSPKEYERYLNWYDASLYCSVLTIDNKNDWRLPTLEELHHIRDYEHDLAEDFHWSCIHHPYNEQTAFIYYGGRAVSDDKTTKFAVRAVRDNI